MAKVHNPFFPDEFRDYLICNGFQEATSLNSVRTIYFFKDGIAVEVIDNKLIISAHYNEEPGQHNSGYAQQAAFDGLSALDIFKFQLLLHITGALPLNRFLKNVVQEGIKTDDLFTVLADRFNPSKMAVVR